jgi:ABC-type polysaccharide/polyol phosphate export permease
MTFLGFDRRDVGMLVNLFRMALGDRFLGSSLGLIWAVLSPLMLMGIFCFVFTFVFPNRLPGSDGSLPYVIWLISGYAPWLGISEGLSSATSSVTGSAGVVKNIAFKSELLPVVGSMLGLVPLAVGLLLIFLLQIGTGHGLSLAIVALPLVIALQLLFVSGLGLFLGPLNVFVRDTSLALPNILTILLFASPIFYPLSAYPGPARAILVYNPFYVLTECYRAPILLGAFPPLWMLAYLIVLAAMFFVAGLWWFRRLKSFFDTRL